MAAAEGADMMHRNMHPRHTHAWPLLPWYVNDSLAEEEHGLVRAHLGECLVCRREVQRLEHLAHAVTGALGEYGCSQAYGRLAAQIHGARQPWHVQAWRTLTRVLQPVPLVAGAAVLVCSATLVAMIVQGGAPRVAPGEQSFQTLGRHADTSASLDRPRLRIVLRDGVSGDALAEWLQRHGAELLDGPSAIGVMTVAVALGPHPFSRVVERMRADADTVFVEPVSQVGVRPDRRR